MNDSTLTRRRLLVASIALSGMAGGLRAARIFAQDRAAATPETRRTLAVMARRLYPHDAIADDVYADVITAALESAAADAALASALDDAEAALNAAANGQFADLDEAAQIRALESVESRPFFATIQARVLAGVYNHPAVWELLGYGGPSWQQGGYLNRGAGEIDWLPETDR